METSNFRRSHIKERIELAKDVIDTKAGDICALRSKELSSLGKARSIVVLIENYLQYPNRESDGSVHDSIDGLLVHILDLLIDAANPKKV